jgi:hypothetical protein
VSYGGGVMDWETEIREREQAAADEFVAADVERLNEILADRFTVNSPLDQVLEKDVLLELVRSGRIRHGIYEIEIEEVRRHGDVVVVMGKDRVTNPPDPAIVHRRYTNVWRLENGTWRTIARHAHVRSLRRRPASR